MKTTMETTVDKADAIAGIIKRIVGGIILDHRYMKMDLERLGQRVVILLQVGRSDMRRVLGKEGKTLESIKSMLRFMAAKTGRQIEIQLLEPEAGMQDSKPPFIPRDAWDKEGVKQLAETVCGLCFESFRGLTIDDGRNFNTVMTINLSTAEDFQITQALKPAFETIFLAIGRIQGRHIMVDILRT